MSSKDFGMKVSFELFMFIESFGLGGFKFSFGLGAFKVSITSIVSFRISIAGF